MNIVSVKKIVFALVFLTATGFCFAQNIRIIGVIPKADTGKSYQLQVGAFRIRSNADVAAAVLTKNGFSPMREKSSGLERVFVVVPSAEVRSTVDRLGRAGFREVVIREYAAGPAVPLEPAEPKVEEPEEAEPAPPEVVPEEIVLPETGPEEFVPPVEEIPEDPVIEEVTEEPPVTESPLEYEDFIFEAEEPEHDLMHLQEAIH